MKQNPGRVAWQSGWFAWAAVSLIYVTSVLILPSQGFWINDNGAKLIQVQGIAQSRMREYAIPWPGQEIDPTYRFNPIPPPIGIIRDGRLYITYSEFFALATAVLFSRLGWAAINLLPLAGGILPLAGLRFLSRFIGAGPLPQNLALFFAGLATPIWFYSVSCWETMPAVALALWSLNFYLLYRRQKNPLHFILSGLLSAGSCYFRADMLLWAGALLGAGLWKPEKPRRLLWFLFSLLLGLLPVGWFHYHTLGSVWGLHLPAHSPFSAGAINFLHERVEVAGMLLLRAHKNHALSFFLMSPWAWLFFLRPSLSGVNYLRATPILLGFGLICSGIVLTAQWLSRHPMENLLELNGLFAAAPVLFLALVRFKQEPSRPDEEEAAFSFAFIRRVEFNFVVLYLIFSPLTSQGIHWGCRFLLILYPLLSLSAAVNVRYGMEQFALYFPIRRILMVLLIALSVTAQIYSLFLLHQRTRFTQRLNEIVAGRTEPTIIATAWFIPQELALNFYSRPIFLVSDHQELIPLLTRLKENGFDRALVISPRQDPKLSPEEETVLDDGLNFISLRLESIPLSGL